jgi:hypothetical protein
MPSSAARSVTYPIACPKGELADLLTASFPSVSAVDASETPGVPASADMCELKLELEV